MKAPQERWLTAFALGGIAICFGAIAIQETRLADKNRRLVTLQQTAQAAGLSAEELSHSVPNRPARESAESSAKRTFGNVMELTRELGILRAAGDPSPEEIRKLQLRINAQLSQVSAAESKLLIHLIRAEEKLDDEDRNYLLRIVMHRLGEIDPKTFLAIVIEPNAQEDRLQYRYVIAQALGRWGREDPQAAKEWLLLHASSRPDLVTASVWTELAVAAAVKDPKLAFEVLSKSSSQETASTTARMLLRPDTREDRLSVVEELRKRISSGAIDERAVFDQIGFHSRDMGFERTSAWIEEAGLTAGEIALIAERVNPRQAPGEAAQWISFLTNKLPPDQLVTPVTTLMRSWTERDHLAAGHWLAASPDDAAKPAAVHGFAEAAAKYDPETAEQWALTLQSGNGRTETLRSIYHRWPADDPTGKAAFSARHGIESH